MKPYSYCPVYPQCQLHCKLNGLTFFYRSILWWFYYYYNFFDNFTQAPGSVKRRRSRRSNRFARKALGEKNEGTHVSLFSQTTVSSCATGTGLPPGGNNISIASTGSYQDFAVCTPIVQSSFKCTIKVQNLIQQLHVVSTPILSFTAFKFHSSVNLCHLANVLYIQTEESRRSSDFFFFRALIYFFVFVAIIMHELCALNVMFIMNIFETLFVFSIFKLDPVYTFI